MAKIAIKQLLDGISSLEKQQKRLKSGLFKRLVVKDQPYDQLLLVKSSLYRQSRRLYLKQSGRFHSTLVSSARTLSSPILLTPIIEYTPLESELRWRATDPIEKQHPERLHELKKYISSLYHEQNHRLLWNLLPSAPKKLELLGKYLNFAESLVITLDMALADQLGPQTAALLKIVGVIYDPGTSVRKEVKSGRMYRNYLQAALHATYLNLELFHPEYIREVVLELFPNLGSLAERAINRSLNLNAGFISKTNLAWQKKHRSQVIEKLAKRSESAIELPKEAHNNRIQYMIAEQWFDLMGL
jgi:hypothetical protein